jgi:hypothetical protein
MNPTDKKLIQLIAETWIGNGGDALGFAYCYNEILTTIQEKQKEAQDGKEDREKP